MRIAVDATCWSNTRGYGRHARGLLTSLVRIDPLNRYVFVLDSEQHDNLPARIETKIIRSSSPTVLAASANGHRSGADLWKMSRALSAPEFDLLLFPTIYSFVPVLTRAKKIVLIHDVIAETFPDLTVPRSTARLFWKTKVAIGRWQADAVVTVSDYSRRTIMEHFGLPYERVSVVGEACDPIFRVLENPQLTARLRSLGLAQNHRYVTYVGGFNPHKNLDSLLMVFAEISSQSEFSDVTLVMVGEQNESFHSCLDRLHRMIEDLRLGTRVIFTGYLPDEDLVVLLNVSVVLVLPSLMEGFGLPAIEAAACGCPVIATKASPLPSLLGDAALYVDPKRPDELDKALARILASESLRKKMSTMGREAAARFTWDAAAQQMLSLINRVARQ